MKVRNSPEIYAEMCKPFATHEDANTAITAFYDDLYELRVKHGLANVSIIVQDSIKDGGMVIGSTHIGSENEAECMAAWHLGTCQAERDERVRKARERAGKP